MMEWAVDFRLTLKLIRFVKYVLIIVLKMIISSA